MLRRTLLSRMFTAAPLLAVQQTPASAPKPSAGAAHHEQDDWLDQAPEKHRVIFDTWMADKFGQAAGFAGNWLRTNKDQYGLTDADLAVVIVARHGTTPYAFNESMWTKYGKIFADNMSTTDKIAHPNPATNVHAAAYGSIG
jgi:hypothetical protein